MPAVRTLRSRPGSGLIDRAHDSKQGGRRNACQDNPNQEHVAFAQWFADWWLRRGRELTDPAQQDGR